jgi:hypothetical protein
LRAFPQPLIASVHRIFRQQPASRVSFACPETQLMRLLFNAVLVAASLSLAAAVFAQTAPSSPPAAPTPAAPAPTAPANGAVAVPVTLGKRMACRAASQAKQGQDRKDQMQLCMEQARLDCLKQAIDQKVVGPQRREFVSSCME